VPGAAGDAAGSREPESEVAGEARCGVVGREEPVCLCAGGGGEYVGEG